MDIYILSSGRPDRQTTLDNLPSFWRDRVTLVVPEKEARAYKKYRILTCPLMGIGHTRQFVIDQGGRDIFMLDDDLVFAARRTDNPTKFRDATDIELMEMFNDVQRQLHDYPAVGVATREGGNRNTDRYAYNTRLLRALAYRGDILRKNKVRFDRLPVMEDFDVALQLLSLGLPNCCINWVVQNQNGSNLPGGCSQYRTNIVQAKAARMLQEFHPDVVRIVEKATKGKGMWASRVDVNVQWKQAYAIGSRTKSRQIHAGKGAHTGAEGKG